MLLYAVVLEINTPVYSRTPELSSGDNVIASRINMWYNLSENRARDRNVSFD